MKVDKRTVREMAQNYDIAIMTIGRNSGEFADRKQDGDFIFTDTEKDMITNVANAFHDKNKKLIVILNVGGVVEMDSWKDKPDAILLAWQPGQEAGNAIADVLTGKINPSGKLAQTFPASYEDVPSSKNFPGRVTQAGDKNGPAKAAEIIYDEGIYTGYRYFNDFYTKVPPSYSFGYGLSYTSFSYDNFKLSSKSFDGKIIATVEVTNTGPVAGKEVVQLYINAPGADLKKPQWELKGFGKTNLLAPGKTQTMSFVIDPWSLASYHTNSSSWIAEEGLYTVKVGPSSGSLVAGADFQLDKEIVVEKVHSVLKPQVEIKN
jgi:beta-glucosidase